MNNLGFEADAQRDLILHQNERLNELIQQEIGVDDGSCYSLRRNFAL